MKTYLDSGVLIAAWNGDEASSRTARQLLLEENREFVYSFAVVLETVGANRRSGNHEAADWYAEVLSKWDYVPACVVAAKFGADFHCQQMWQRWDLLHFATAAAHAKEFITTEKITKPYFKTNAAIKVSTIHEQGE